jgi:hypothetical protein
MANHKWENEVCIKCGLKKETTNIYNDDGSVNRGYHYSFDGKDWSIRRPECLQNVNIKDVAIKKIIKESKPTYSELLKNPKWQKKRLEILQRDNFRCRSCDDDLNTLHVHHWNYDNQLNPWEYKDDDLITLCETCHEALHYLTANKNIGFETFVPLIKLIEEIEFKEIAEYLATYEKNKSNNG